MKICTVDNCPRESRAKGYCVTHLYNFKTYGDALYQAKKRLKITRICEVKSCGRMYHAKGYCGAHYVRWRAYGKADYPLHDAAIRKRRVKQEKKKAKPEKVVEKSPMETFMESVKVSPRGDWLWIGDVKSVNGIYNRKCRYFFEGEWQEAQRVVYYLAKGERLTGAYRMYCRDMFCVNPEHIIKEG